MFAITMTENRLVVMRRASTLIFISVFCSFALGSSDFHLINLEKSYEDSKSYCRERNTDLATIHNSTDMNGLITFVSNSTPRAWIGLEFGDVWMWHWSRPDQKTDFFNWKAGEPKDTNEDACAAMDPGGEWFESDCGTTRSFVCHGGGNASGPIFVAQLQSWRNAQSHCRGLSSNLVSIQSAEENRAVRDVSQSQNVWIGLFKDPWKWSDGSNSSFRFWRPNQPNYNNAQECAAAVFRLGGQWNDLRCSGKRNFICRGALKPIPATTTAQNSTQGISTTNSSQVTITFHFTVATNNQSNTTSVTTAASTTVSVPTTPNTTYPASHGSSNELNTTTATTLQPPETTLNATTLTTPNGTSAESTTQSSIPSLHPETLILIQDNMTWIEAMSYCRQHHIDLVHIPTKDIQDKVAEEAKNATTAHVWLGLRYTCKFKFWFWTKMTSGCYQNWVEGEGSDVEYQCGVSGAIEATGRQQWVGLNETERLNFICFTCAG